MSDETNEGLDLEQANGDRRMNEAAAQQIRLPTLACQTGGQRGGPLA